MADASSAFKVQCPSCEARVTVKDPNLAGKKIDCPKCKYRFVVEMPAKSDGDAEKAPVKKPNTAGTATKTKTKAATTDGAAPKSKNKPLPKADDEANGEEGKKKKKKKKDKSNTTLIAGGGLGLIAIVVLICYFTGVFDSDDAGGGGAAPPSQDQVKGPPVNTGVPTPSKQVKIGNPGEVTKEPPKLILKPEEIARKDPTNLLPGESQYVLKISSENFIKSPVGAVFFDESSDTAGAFKRWMGFGGDEVDRFICAGGIDTPWFFGVFRLKRDIAIENLQTAMVLDPKPKEFAPPAPKGKNKSIEKPRLMYTVQSNEIVKMLGDYLAARLPTIGVNIAQSNGTRTYALNLLDSRTVILADQAMLEKFLQADAKPKFITTYSPIDQSMPTNPGGTMSDPMPMPKDPMGEPKDPMGEPKDPKGEPMPKDPMGEPMPKGMGGRPSFTSNPSFLTVDATLKSMLNQLEDEKGSVLVFASKLTDSHRVMGELVRKYGAAAGLAISLIPKQTVVGLGIKRMDETKLSAQAAIEYSDSKDPLDLSQNPIVQKFAQYLANELTQMTRVQVLVGQSGPVDPNAPPPPPPVESDPNNPMPIPASFVSIRAADKLLFINVDIEWNAQLYYNHISPSIRTHVDQLKGEAMMMTGRAHWHQLGSVTKRFEQQGSLPVAAYPRQTDQSRFDLPYTPDQRVSWMCEMLPFLGYEGLSRRIDREQPWNQEKNLQAGSAWISEFLNPEFGSETWRAHVPSLKGRDLGATHFVGLTGIGMESGEFPDTPEYAKKLGMFGWNRQTKFADVASGDGLSNTIFMIQVPPNVARPWLRGGGATAQGVPASGSIKPFVAQLKSGRAGTYALMADGSVRFLKDGIEDPVFQALVTYKGGEQFGNLDQLAPKEKSRDAAPVTPMPLPKVEPPKADPPKQDPPKKMDPVKTDPPKVEPPKVGPSKVEPPKVEPAK